MSDPPQSRQLRRLQAVRPLLRDAAPLVMLGSLLFYTNGFLALTNEESSAISGAAANWNGLLAGFRSPAGGTLPPVYALLLRSWLWITHGAFDTLRAPSIIFFLLGLWLLSRVARLQGGDESSNALVWLGALWPFGFHYGRVEGPYTFAFLLIAAITWQYFRGIASRRRSDWILFCVLSLLLLYTSDLGWALLLLLGMDYWRRIPEIDESQTAPLERARTGKINSVLSTLAVLAIGFAPRWPAFVHQLLSIAWPHSFRFLIVDAAYNFYIMFVSSSVAPWFWRLSVPASIGVIVLLALLFVGVRRQERSFLIFSLLLFTLMATTASLQPERLLLVASWFLLPLAVALGTIEKSQWRIPMAFALAGVAAIGWYGVFNKRYYAEVSFLEPWNSLAQDAADALRGGSGVISNDRSFFLYLTYAVKPVLPNSSSRFNGLLPAEVQYPSVWNPTEWENAGRPKPDGVLWIRGSSAPDELTAMNNAGDWLSDHCGDRTTRLLARDPAYLWKQRFVPNFSGPPWRIEIRQYICGQAPPTPKIGGAPDRPK